MTLLSQPNAIRSNHLLAQTKALNNELPDHLRSGFVAGEDLYEDPDERYDDEDR